MNEIGLVLDASALLSYAEGGELVGRRLPLAYAAAGAVSHPIVPLMTAHRDLVTQFLPKEWPIIDVE